MVNQIRALALCGALLLAVAAYPADLFAGASTLSSAVRTKENMEPALSRPEQEAQVSKQLAALKAKTGQRPNILILMADDGKSMREKVFVWSQNDFLAVRMYEYKEHFQVIDTDRTFLNIDMAKKSNLGLAPWLFNLYIDPKEQYPVGHRRNAWLASIAAEAKVHAATFRKYPPKEVGLSTKIGK